MHLCVYCNHNALHSPGCLLSNATLNHTEQTRDNCQRPSISIYLMGLSVDSAYADIVHFKLPVKTILNPQAIYTVQYDISTPQLRIGQEDKMR